MTEYNIEVGKLGDKLDCLGIKPPLQTSMKALIYAAELQEGIPAAFFTDVRPDTTEPYSVAFVSHASSEDLMIRAERIAGILRATGVQAIVNPNIKILEVNGMFHNGSTPTT